MCAERLSVHTHEVSVRLIRLTLVLGVADGAIVDQAHARQIRIHYAQILDI
jgi:hypothetical protein